MALDVYVVDDPRRRGLTGDLPACQFEEAVHTYIFHGAGVDVYNRYACLRRMMDFYADASYANGNEPVIEWQRTATNQDNEPRQQQRTKAQTLRPTAGKAGGNRQYRMETALA